MFAFPTRNYCFFRSPFTRPPKRNPGGQRGQPQFSSEDRGQISNLSEIPELRFVNIFKISKYLNNLFYISYFAGNLRQVLVGDESHSQEILKGEYHYYHHYMYHQYHYYLNQYNYHNYFHFND